MAEQSTQSPPKAPAPAPAPSPAPAPAPEKALKARAVHGRMVDVLTGTEYGQQAFTPVVPSTWFDAQVEAGKLELE